MSPTPTMQTIMSKGLLEADGFARYGRADGCRYDDAKHHEMWAGDREASDQKGRNTGARRRRITSARPER
jgi:hypothetical protein